MSVLIVGAGSMGLVSGYYLQLSNVEVTFLVRSHHKKDLDRPQILYDLSDNTVKHYTGYNYFTDPSQILGRDYDFIIITLDRTGLQSEEGTQLVKTIAKAVKGKSTQIILGTVTIGVRSWLLEVSGISPEKVTNGSLGVMAYPPKSVTLPIYSDDIDRKILAIHSLLMIVQQR
ncbi:DEKNAAC102464 [Brettanomyces naardenensis]|uniref:DEKNAAC102464 n=1 Tax=Brettanomyces naardenensis TaxID=13370 RepID=A0A448YLR4_BRENA|nr:DEKNAAC102464 [Brettanomyces naardenensis]